MQNSKSNKTYNNNKDSRKFGKIGRVTSSLLPASCRVAAASASASASVAVAVTAGASACAKHLRNFLQAQQRKVEHAVLLAAIKLGAGLQASSYIEPTVGRTGNGERR